MEGRPPEAAEIAEGIDILRMLPGEVFLNLRPQSFLTDSKVCCHQPKMLKLEEKYIHFQGLLPHSHPTTSKKILSAAYSKGLSTSDEVGKCLWYICSPKF